MQVKTNQDKKEFMQWFLNTYQLAKKEYTWLFNYLRSTDEQLEKVHFVDYFDEKKHKKRIILHTNCSNRPGYFVFNMNDIVSDYPEKAFHNIRQNPEEHIYVKLEYRNKDKCTKWLDVVEDNDNGSTGFEVAAQLILEQSLENYTIDQLKKQIDQALIDGNKELFMKLTNELLHTENKLVKSF
jgi:uncharacterized protein YpiB (UPF0302 family)